MALSHADAAEFLYEEARLIDERRYDEWLALFAEDGIYWLPIDETAGPRDHLSLIYDDALRRSERIYRLTHGALAQSPPSRTIHFISNVQVEGGEGDHAAAVHSVQLVHEMRGGDDRQLELGDQRSFAARCVHHLRREERGLRIVLKRMVLLNRAVPIPNLTFIL